MRSLSARRKRLGVVNTPVDIMLSVCYREPLRGVRLPHHGLLGAHDVLGDLGTWKLRSTEMSQQFILKSFGQNIWLSPKVFCPTLPR
jgi:hypothetical protein